MLPMTKRQPHEQSQSWRICAFYRIIRHCHILEHYSDVIMSSMASQITSLTIVYSTVYSCAAQRKHQSSASPAFIRGSHRWPVNSPHKWQATRKMFPFDDVIMGCKPSCEIRARKLSSHQMPSMSCGHITVMAHERRGASNHQQLEYFLSVFRFFTKKRKRCALLALLKMWPVMRKSSPYHGEWVVNAGPDIKCTNFNIYHAKIWLVLHQ